MTQGHTEEKPFNLYVIGGSNATLKNGFIPCMRVNLENRLGRRVVVHNKSVGGTFISCGLWQVARGDAHESADLIVIEYALNDAELASGRMIDYWGRAFEGTLQRLRSENPTAPILCPVFYAETGTHVNRMSSIAAGVAMIGARYGVHVMDMNDALQSRIPPEFAESAAKLHRDRSHYAPHVHMLIAELLCNQAMEALANPTPARLHVPQVYRRTYAEAKVLGEDLAKYATGETSIQRFHNSQFDETALQLAEGASLSFRIQGQILAVMLINTDADGVMEFRFGDQKQNIGLMRRALESETRTFKFLLNSLLPDQYNNGRLFEAFDAPKTVHMRLLPREESKRLSDDDIRLRPTSRRPEQYDEPHVLNIVDILYVGEITPV